MHTSFPSNAKGMSNGPAPICAMLNNARMGLFDLGDERLNRAGEDLRNSMLNNQSVCLRTLGHGRAGEVRFGRFLANIRTTVKKLIDGVCAGIKERCRDRHVLAIQDTTEINYQSHADRVNGLGTVGNGTDKGLFLHPVVVVDAQDGACLGLAHIHLWQRIKGKAANYFKLPIEDKESHRWIDAAMKALARLCLACKVTMVADRESDIFELWDRLSKHMELLIRASSDRILDIGEKGLTLFTWLAALPVQGSYTLEVKGRKGQRTQHQALMRVRFGKTKIKRPYACTDKNAANSQELWAIEVREDDSTVVGQEKPIHWRLLTTHPIESMEQARQCVQWYCQRWHIEQTFRTLKLQGLNLESSMVEEARRLEKLAVLAVSAAVHTMQLTLAREGNTDRPASDCVNPADYPMLEHLCSTKEGKTQKQKNPHTKHTLGWLGWIVARLGGWKGYASERKPGPITMLHGLRALQNIRYGWYMASAG